MLLPRSASVRKRASVRRVVTLFLLLAGAASISSSRLFAASGGNEGVADKSAHHATLTPASANSSDVASDALLKNDVLPRNYDPEAERTLLDLANQARARSGAPRLILDAGMNQAARAHAESMFAARRISHQVEGEPALPQRLGTATHVQLDEEAENVALDISAANGHQHLMLSPPHRANLLNPAYNVVGFGVVRSGGRLYIVQDFGHALPNYSATEVKGRIAATVARVRRQADQPALARSDLPAADAAACAMAQADRLVTPPVDQFAQRSTVLAYTSLHPGTLPASAGDVLASHNLRSFSVGTCYARTGTYPTGVYWVVLSLE
jgi:uncharacterized protein YkwD